MGSITAYCRLLSEESREKRVCEHIRTTANICMCQLVSGYSDFVTILSFVFVRLSEQSVTNQVSCMGISSVYITIQ